MSYVFNNATKFNGSLRSWTTDNVQDINGLFAGQKTLIKILVPGMFLMWLKCLKCFEPQQNSMLI